MEKTLGTGNLSGQKMGCIMYLLIVTFKEKGASVLPTLIFIWLIYMTNTPVD